MFNVWDVLVEVFTSELRDQMKRLEIENDRLKSERNSSEPTEERIYRLEDECEGLRRESRTIQGKLFESQKKSEQLQAELNTTRQQQKALNFQVFCVFAFWAI